MVIVFFSRSHCAVCIPARSFLLPSDSKAATNPFSVATFSKIQLDYPKEFCQFFQACKFGLAYSFLGHWSRTRLFWRIALLKTIFKVAISKNQNYATTTFLLTLSFLLFLFSLNFLFFSLLILVLFSFQDCTPNAI